MRAEITDEYLVCIPLLNDVDLDTFHVFAIRQFVRGGDATKAATVLFWTPPGYCDLQETPNIPLRNGLTQACYCVAAVDVLDADILFEADDCTTGGVCVGGGGVPVFPACAVSSSDGGGLDVESNVEVELCSNACALVAANGVCEEGGIANGSSTASSSTTTTSTELGSSDCKDCDPRMDVRGKPSVETVVQRAKDYACRQMQNSECISSSSVMVEAAYYPIWAEDAAVALWTTTCTGDENHGTGNWAPPSCCKGTMCQMPGCTNFGRLGTFHYETPTPFTSVVDFGSAAAVDLTRLLTMMEIDMQDGCTTKVLGGNAKMMRPPFDDVVGGSINYADTKGLNQKCGIKTMVGSSKTTSKLHFAFHTGPSTLEPSTTAPAETPRPPIDCVSDLGDETCNALYVNDPTGVSPDGTPNVPTTNPDCVNDLGDETCNALYVAFSGFCAAVEVKRACARLCGTCYGTNVPSFAPTVNPTFAPTAEPTNAEPREESPTLDPNGLPTNAVSGDAMCDLLVETLLSGFCAADVVGARRRQCGTCCPTGSPTMGTANPAAMLSAHPTSIPAAAPTGFMNVLAVHIHTATGRSVVVTDDTEVFATFADAESVSSGLRMHISPRRGTTVYTSAHVDFGPKPAVNLRRRLRETTSTLEEFGGLTKMLHLGGGTTTLPFNGGVAQDVDESTVVPTAAPNVVPTANPASSSSCVDELGEAECLELVKEVHGFCLLEFESSFCLRTCGRCSPTLFPTLLPTFISCLHSSYASDFAPSSVSTALSINVHSSCASAVSSMRSFSSMGSMGSFSSMGFTGSSMGSMGSFSPCISGLYFPFSESSLYSSYASDWSFMGPSFSESDRFYSSYSYYSESEWFSRATEAPTEFPTNPPPTVHSTMERPTTDPTIYATIISIYATAISLHLFVLNAKVWPARRHYGGTMAMLVLTVIALPGTDADATDLSAVTRSRYKEHIRKDDFAYAPCDATRLLPYAVDIGDCTAFLRHDATCTQTGLDGYTCFSKCQHGTLVDGRCFQAGVVIDLATVSNPYRGSTSGNPNAISLCGNGPEQAFSYVLAPGHGIAIGQTSTSFDSMHTLRHGGQFPGEVSVDCVDAPDESPLEFLNDGVEDVTVYFIVDASSSGEAGAFTVEWRFYTVGPDPTTVTTNLWPELRPRQGRVLNAYTSLTDSNIMAAAQLWVSDQASANSTYGLVNTWDVSQVTSLQKVWCGLNEIECGSAYVAMRSFNGGISTWDVSKVTTMSKSKSKLLRCLFMNSAAFSCLTFMRLHALCCTFIFENLTEFSCFFWAVVSFSYEISCFWVHNYRVRFPYESS